MKSILIPSTITALLFSTLAFPALAANKPPEKGEGLPVINLPIPKNPDQKKLFRAFWKRSFQNSKDQGKGSHR